MIEVFTTHSAGDKHVRHTPCSHWREWLTGRWRRRSALPPQIPMMPRGSGTWHTPCQLGASAAQMCSAVHSLYVAVSPFHVDCQRWFGYGVFGGSTIIGALVRRWMHESKLRSWGWWQLVVYDVFCFGSRVVFSGDRLSALQGEDRVLLSKGTIKHTHQDDDTAQPGHQGCPLPVLRNVGPCICTETCKLITDTIDSMWYRGGRSIIHIILKY